MTNKRFLFFSKYIVWFVFLIAFVLRFWNLGITPPSLYWDEVSQAFNSYSILSTGYDEHREFLPVTRFQAFGDYKAPVYIYLDILPILLFGQTELAVRFPSALLGFLTVVLTYYLTKELFYNNKKREQIALISSLLLAISPWHIQLSRAAYEANIATFFTISGILLFFLALRKNFLYLYFSTISLVIAFYSFNAHRIFIPHMVLLLVILNFKKIMTIKFKLIPIVVLGFFLLIPFLFYLKSPESKLRFQEVNIFSDLSRIELSNRLIEQDDNNLIGKIIHNRRIIYALSYINHYFDFQNPSYLFFEGDQNPRFSTRENGELYLIVLPFLLIGIYQLIKSKEKNKLLLFGWFIISPIAAATARETPHALRSETFIPLYDIFTAYGLVYFLGFVKNIKKWKRYSLYIAILSLFTFYFIEFLHMYFIHMPNRYSQDWQYGYKEAVKSVEEIKNNYDQIIFTNAYGRAYIYVLWYGKYKANEYWDKGIVKKDSFGFYNVEGFDKYSFVSPHEAKYDNSKRILFVGIPGEIPKESRIIKTVNFTNGQPAFIISQNK